MKYKYCCEKKTPKHRVLLAKELPLPDYRYCYCCVHCKNTLLQSSHTYSLVTNIHVLGEVSLFVSINRVINQGTANQRYMVLVRPV